MSTIQEMQQTIETAENEIRRALYVVPDMIKVCTGRLKVASNQASYSYFRNLAALKKELESFNAKTMRWKE